MDNKGKNILTYGFWFMVAAVLLYFCLQAVDWKDFGAALLQCQWEYILLAMLLGALALFLRGARWQMLLKPIDPSTKVVTCFNAYNICTASNLVLPRLGEVIRLGYVVKHSATGEDGKRMVGFDKVLGTAVVERTWDAASVLLLTALLLVLKWEDFGPFLMGSVEGGRWWILPAVALLALALLLAAWLLRSTGPGQKVWGFVRGIGNGLVSFAHMRRPWLFLLYTAVIWALHWLTSASIIWALQGIEAFASLSLTDAFFLMIVGSLSSIIPVPGGFGAYHGIVTAALSTVLGIPVGLGMVYATLNHESQVLMQAIMGIGSYIHESFIRKS